MRKHSLNSAIYALALLLAIACGKDNNDNGNNNNPVTPGGADITSYDQIASAHDRTELVGKTVSLDTVPVARVVGTYTFWIGDTGSGIPVVRQDRINGPVSSHVQANHHARVVGTIRLASAVDANDQMWRSINSDERRDIENAKVFIRADRVEPQP